MDANLQGCDCCGEEGGVMAVSMSVGTQRLIFLQDFRIRPLLTRHVSKQLRCAPVQEQVLNFLELQFIG